MTCCASSASTSRSPRCRCSPYCQAAQAAQPPSAQSVWPGEGRVQRGQSPNAWQARARGADASRFQRALSFWPRAGACDAETGCNGLRRTLCTVTSTWTPGTLRAADGQPIPHLCGRHSGAGTGVARHAQRRRRARDSEWLILLAQRWARWARRGFARLDAPRGCDRRVSRSHPTRADVIPHRIQLASGSTETSVKESRGDERWRRQKR